MNTTKIIIKNLFGIKEMALDGKSVEITGAKGVGKTSIIDAIRYGLTNASDRDYIIKNGETEGEIIIETNTGLLVNRKKRASQSDYKSIKENGKDVPRPESFLQEIFTPLSLNPVEFTLMNKQEQNRIILDLIDFQWDLNWIKEQFGEIPPGVDYDQNILKVLSDIQSENGSYFQRRQDLNRDARNKQAFIHDISKDIPEDYDAAKWEAYELGPKYRELETIKNRNNEIQRAIVFKENYNNKIRGYEAEKEIAITSEEKAIAVERESLQKNIERMKAEIIAAEDKLKGLASKLEDKKKIAIAEYETKVAKLDSEIKIANEYAEKKPTDTAELNAEIDTAEAMKKHLNEYKRMTTMQKELEQLKVDSEELTRKIELARTLPGEILKTATIPIEGLTVKDGIPLINGLPVSNLSDGEKLDLCVDITISKPSAWKIILLDGTEKLDENSRLKLYKKCKDKGLQFIATRTTNDNELIITQL
jgi:DNA repair exonuclease SbcCD ATPase subunit